MSRQMNIFQARPVTDEFDNKLSALDFYNETIFTGDEKGYIYKNPIQYDQFSIKTVKPQKIQISNKKIESIKVLDFSGNLLVLSDGCLYHYDPKSNQQEIIHKKNVILFEVNWSKKNEILVIDKKEKRGYIYQIDKVINIKAVEIAKTSSFPTQPSQIQFLENYIYIAFNKREYQRMDISTKDFNVEQVPIQIPSNNISYIYITGPDEILFHSQNSLGIFIGRNNNPVEKNNLVFKNDQQILHCKIVMPYIVIAYEKIIKIYNLQNGNEMQEILPVQKESIKCMSVSGNKLFYGTNKDLIYLELTPYENLIKKNINAGKIPEALSIFNSNVDRSHPEREQKLEQFYLDASWGLIKLLQWNQARDMIIKNNLNMDIRELICLYHDLVPSTKNLIPDSTRKQTIGQLIHQQLQMELKGSNVEINQLVSKEKIRSELFLAEIIENFRQQNSTLSGVSLKETITFKTSQESVNGSIKGSVSLEELRELIDFVLIRIYIKQEKTKNLKDLLYKGDLLCQRLYGDLQEEITRKYQTQDNHQILAIFYESFGKIKESLEIWKSVGENMSITDKNVIDEACENTVRILKQVKDRSQIKNYLKWVLRKNSNIGSKLFINISESIIPPDQMLDYFINDVYPDDNQKKERKEIKEKYLEVIVFDKHIEEERFHTKLALCYIEESLFTIFSKNTKDTEIDEKNKEVEYYRKKLKDFLESPSAKYNSSTLLDKIKYSWLFQEMLFLYGKEKKHNEALQILIYKQEFELAEKYCEEKTEKLLTNLFEIYVGFYQKQKVQAEKEGTKEALRKVDVFKQKIYNLMNKYATHSQLDQVKVLKLIPSDCILADSGPDDGLYSFISATISHTLHEKRSLKSAHNLSKMDELNVKCSLVNTKKAYIKIQSETKCQVCTRGIGDKAFVVYPNGVAAHYTCVQNIGVSVCPKTGQDFQKTFRGL